MLTVNRQSYINQLLLNFEIARPQALVRVSNTRVIRVRRTRVIRIRVRRR